MCAPCRLRAAPCRACRGPRGRQQARAVPAGHTIDRAQLHAAVDLARRSRPPSGLREPQPSVLRPAGGSRSTTRRPQGQSEYSGRSQHRQAAGSARSAVLRCGTGVGAAPTATGSQSGRYLPSPGQPISSITPDGSASERASTGVGGRTVYDEGVRRLTLVRPRRNRAAVFFRPRIVVPTFVFRSAPDDLRTAGTAQCRVHNISSAMMRPWCRPILVPGARGG